MFKIDVTYVRSKGPDGTNPEHRERIRVSMGEAYVNAVPTVGTIWIHGNQHYHVMSLEMKSLDPKENIPRIRHGIIITEVSRG
jgi:hypothetical protein